MYFSHKLKKIGSMFIKAHNKRRKENKEIYIYSFFLFTLLLQNKHDWENNKGHKSILASLPAIAMLETKSRKKGNKSFSFETSQTKKTTAVTEPIPAMISSEKKYH